MIFKTVGPSPPRALSLASENYLDTSFFQYICAFSFAMKCLNCGDSEIRENANFCLECGQKLNSPGILAKKNGLT